MDPFFPADAYALCKFELSTLSFQDSPVQPQSTIYSDSSHNDEMDLEKVIEECTSEIETVCKQKIDSLEKLNKISNTLVAAISKTNESKKRIGITKRSRVNREATKKLNLELGKLNAKLAHEGGKVNLDLNEKVGKQVVVLSKQFDTEDSFELSNHPAFIGPKMRKVFDEILPILLAQGNNLDAKDYRKFVDECTTVIFSSYPNQNRYFIRPNWSVLDTTSGSEDVKLYAIIRQIVENNKTRLQSNMIMHCARTNDWTFCYPSYTNKIADRLLISPNHLNLDSLDAITEELERNGSKPIAELTENFATKVRDAYASVIL